MPFYEEFVSSFSIVFFVGVTRPIVKSGMLIVLGVSEVSEELWKSQILGHYLGQQNINWNLIPESYHIRYQY